MNFKKITFLGAILASFIGNTVIAMEGADDQPVLARRYAHNQGNLSWSVIQKEEDMYKRLLVIEYAGNQNCTEVSVQGAPGVSSMNLGSPYEWGAENRTATIGIISIDNLREGQVVDFYVYSSPNSAHWIRPQADLALGVEPQWHLGAIQVTNTVDAIAPWLEYRQNGYHIN